MSFSLFSLFLCPYLRVYVSRDSRCIGALLQEKLHQNLARRRTLVAVGTHDLNKFAPGEVSYEVSRRTVAVSVCNTALTHVKRQALPPREISFAPLNKETVYNAEELMELYETDKHLAKYLPIIRDSPIYPIIYSSAREVLSMPPIVSICDASFPLRKD